VHFADTIAAAFRPPRDAGSAIPRGQGIPNWLWDLQPYLLFGAAF